MHIGFLTPEYPHHNLGPAAGLGTSIKNLAEALINRNHKVTVFVCNQDSSQVFAQDGITIHAIAKKSYKLGGFYFYRKHVADYINSNAGDIDILEAPDWTGLTAFCRFKIPHVIKIHGSDTYFCHLSNRPQKKKNRLFEKLALRNADGVGAVSAFAGEVTKNLFELNQEISTCYNIIDTSLFVPSSKESTDKYILNFGTIIRKKGVIELAKAFNLVHERYPDIFLYYLGGDVKDNQTGESTIALIKKVLNDSAGGMVKFLPKVPYDQVLDYISQSQLICLPSHAEAFPMTWLEAMAMQKPLVASNVGWSEEIIDNGVNGIAVDAHKTTSLAESINLLLGDEAKREQLGKAGRATILEKFNADELIKANLDFYNRVMSKAK